MPLTYLSHRRINRFCRSYTAAQNSVDLSVTSARSSSVIICWLKQAFSASSSISFGGVSHRFSFETYFHANMTALFVSSNANRLSRYFIISDLFR